MSLSPIPANVIGSRYLGSDAQSGGADSVEGRGVDSFMIVRSREITGPHKLRVVVLLQSSRALLNTDDLGMPPPIEEVQEAANNFIR